MSFLKHLFSNDYKNPYAIKIFERDSLFIKADSLFAVGPENNRIIKGRFNVKFIKSIMSGKSDQFIMNQNNGLIRLLRNDLSKEEQILTSKEISKKIQLYGTETVK